MITDEPERAIAEAEGWLASAKDLLPRVREKGELANVCCSQAIHAIIRANDALCLRFLNVKATRHDDAVVLFAKLIKLGKLPEDAAKFKELVASAMMDKSGADYGKDEFTYDNASEYVKRTVEFILMVRDILKIR